MQNHDITIEKHPLKGILICLLAYFFISLTGIFSKFLTQTTSISIILFFQNIICFLLITAGLIKNKISILKPQHISTYLVRIISGLACYASLFYIIKFIPISEALIYQYSASLWIPFIMLFWWNVRMPRQLWWGILIGFVGILLILKPGSAHLGFVSLIGLICAISQALSVVSVRKLSINEPMLRILFYYFLVGTIISTPFLIINWTPLTLNNLLLLSAVGLSTYLAQRFFTAAFHYANATTLAPICYSSILFSGLFGWFFWHEMPAGITLLGMILVIAGCLLSVVMSREKSVAAFD